ncbi:glycosyltransferase [Arthrobacter sp. MPF02]|uniref:CgeB family protein n=1 Tax=Arthrobacter sp. MPF02 TaxID=3388492 RepID=UPI0039850ACD
MRILFVGDAWLGSNARSLANGFRAAGHTVLQVDTAPLNVPERWGAPWVYSKLKGEKSPQIISAIHNRIDRAVADFKPDILFCFKTIHLNQERLLSLDGLVRVHYSADDVSNPYNVTSAYLQFECEWDSVVTTKFHNVAELEARGARNVQYVMSAYDPALHHPVAQLADEQYNVGFLGNLRRDRIELIRMLAARYGSRFVVGGPGWRTDRVLRRSQASVQPGAYGEDFSYFVSAVRANLVLLNSDNRDAHTCRSFEVPAAGGLFVGERTDEHQLILDDDKEAFMFSSNDELMDVLEQIQSNPREAAQRAVRGFLRIRSSHHTYEDRARQIVNGLQLK